MKRITEKTFDFEKPNQGHLLVSRYKNLEKYPKSYTRHIHACTVTRLLQKNNKKINKYTAQIFSIILGFLFIFFIIWNRLIRTRLPYEIKGNYSEIQIIFIIILSLIFTSFSLYYLRKILNINLKPNSIIFKIASIYFIAQIIDLYYKYILNAPENAYEFLYRYIRIADFVQYVGAKIWNMDPYKYPLHLYVFSQIFRILAATIFFIDVFYFFRLYYFYKILYVLIIPLITDFFLFVIKHCSTKNRKEITDKYIKLTSNHEINGFNLESIEGSNLTDDEEYEWYNTWIMYTANCMFVDKFYEINHRYNKYLMFICYTIYAIGWGYIATLYWI